MIKIRIGIDLDHVIRDINKQIVKYYQQDINPRIDMDEVDYLDDVITKVCNFKSKRQRDIFLYEEYPLEVFGHAGQMERFLSRDLNLWMEKLTNQDKYDVEIFFYSMKEYGLTIQSSYFFLSKIGSRVRKVVFPKTLDELSQYGDIFITAYADTAKYLHGQKKGVILVKTHFNTDAAKDADEAFDSFRDFMDCEDKLDKIIKIDRKWQKREAKSLWTLMQSWISSLLPKKRG